MSNVYKSDSMAAYSTAECIKIHKRLATCKKNVEHEEKYEKSKKRKNYLRSNSPDNDSEFKPKKHKAEEDKTETHQSKKRDRSRSKHRSRSPKSDKKPRRSRSRSSRDSEKILKKNPFKINRNNFLVPQRVLSTGIAEKDSAAKIPTNTLNELTVPKMDTEPVTKLISNPNNTVVMDTVMDYQDPHPAVEPSAFTNTYVHGNNYLLTYETEKCTGHIGTKVPSPAVLSSENQPLVNKDQLENAASMNSGIGMINGEGLGQNQSGSLEPVSLDVETDKRGLVTEEKRKGNRTEKRSSKKVAKPILSIEGKHRVRSLYELCVKRKWEDLCSIK